MEVCICSNVCSRMLSDNEHKIPFNESLAHYCGKILPNQNISYQLSDRFEFSRPHGWEIPSSVFKDSISCHWLDYDEASDLLYLFYTFMFIAIFLVGMSANLLVILVYLRYHHKYHTQFSQFLPIKSGRNRQSLSHSSD